MTRYECEQIVKNIAYRPGWRFIVREDNISDFLKLMIEGEVINAYMHREQTRIVQVNTFDPSTFPRPIDFLKWIRGALIQMEIHECEEFFEFHGKKIFDPHREN